MPGKVLFEVTTGAQAGQKYEYDRAERIYIGRQRDCGIVLPDNTVSRYHCLLSVNPPIVRLQDFGSLNGTFINERKIGQREREFSAEEAREIERPAYELHDGDRIRVGRNCEIKCHIEQPKSSPAEGDCLNSDCAEDQDKILDEILTALLGDKKEKWEKREPEPSFLNGFDKLTRLGKGGMSEVWKVRERKTGKIYALKTMLPQVAADERGKKQFLREAMLCEQLRHSNVIRTYQTGCQNWVFYILMDFCEGGSTEDLIRKNDGKLSLNLATWIILQALDGLDYVHNAAVTAALCGREPSSDGAETIVIRGLVHRDFKPGNIFLSDRSDHPRAMIADFGMAKAFEAAGMTDMTGNGYASGTIPFIPRQQALNYRYAKAEVDVWAAAASYYYMLTGQFPKPLKSGIDIWQSLVSEIAVPIRKRDPSVPERLAEVIDSALIDSPEIGCKTAAALREQIVTALPADTKEYCRSLIRNNLPNG